MLDSMLKYGFKVAIAGFDNDLFTFTQNANNEISFETLGITDPFTATGWTTLYTYGHDPVFESEGDIIADNGGVLVDKSFDRLKLNLKVAFEKVADGLELEGILKDLKKKKTILFYAGDLLALTPWVSSAGTVIPVIFKRTINYDYKTGYSQHTIEIEKRYLEK